MAETTVTATAITASGVTYMGAAANADGSKLLNTGSEAVFIVNGGASPITVTFVTQKTEDGLAVADLAVTVANSNQMAIGPFPRHLYNDASGYLHWTYSGVSSVTVKVLSLTPSSV